MGLEGRVLGQRLAPMLTVTQVRNLSVLSASLQTGGQQSPCKSPARTAPGRGSCVSHGALTTPF